MILVILSHKSIVLNFLPIANRTEMGKLFLGPISILFRSCYLFTDKFFMLSGLLVTNSIYERMKRGKKIDFRDEILGRYFRFMPPIAALILFATYISPLTGSGPLWPSMVHYKSELCKQSGWLNFFMLQNFIGFDHICMANTHHVATDFILFTVSTFMVVFMFHHPGKGFLCVLILALLSSAARFYIMYTKNLIIYVEHGLT